MELANQIFFIVFGLISIAIALSAIPQFQAEKIDKPSIYWPLSTLFFALSSISFDFALWINSFLLTLANISLLISSLALVFLYRSWNRKPFNRIQTLLIWLIPLVIAIFYELLRTTPNTSHHRVALIMVTQEIFIGWQIRELIKTYKKEQPRMIGWLILITIFTLMANLLRIYRIMTIDSLTNIYIYTEDNFVLALQWITYASNIIAFLALGVLYLQKQIKKENQITNALERSKEENQKITELLKEKERLIYGLMKANKTVANTALSGSIGQELNQPLGASNFNIQFLKTTLEKGAHNPELARDILDSLEEDNMRAATIVKSLRAIFSEGTADRKDVQLEDLIIKVLDIVKPELKSRNIQPQIRVDEGLLIRVNPTEIEKVILNLLNNAIQSLANYGSLARRISIEIIKVGQSIHLSVSDNGEGVSAEFKPHLFDLFSTTRKSSMGLGLWFCKHIITKYGGSIHYEDVVGGGARFVVEFPPG